MLATIRRGGETPILVLVDGDSQRMSKRDELLGLNECLAHLAKCLLHADALGHPTIGLLYGHAAAGAFIATALATRTLVALPGGAWIVSCSPELFVEKTGALLRARPMKGTAPRSDDPREDAAAARFLANDAKNRAENVMIVDLLRNDLARIARTGSVTVPALFSVEPYASVWQMTSTVEAGIVEGATFADVPDGTYFVRIAAIDSHGLEGQPRIYAFERRRCGGAASAAPADGGYAFRWSTTQDGAAAGATRFRFVLSRSKDLSNPIVDQVDAQGGRIAVSNLTPGDYYWSVIAERYEGGRFHEKASAVNAFTIAR